MENNLKNSIKKIDTVILDFGKVLIDFTPIDFLKSLGISDEKLEQVYKAVIGNEIWEEYDRGIITEEETLDKFIKRKPHLEKEIRKTFYNLEGIVKKYDYTDSWIKDLKNRGYRVLYLSNLSEKLFRECNKEFDYIKNMDGGIISFKEKMKKPEREIYERLIEKYELIPPKSVFIDDRQENLVEAGNLGINTILFKNYEDTCNKISEFYVK